MSGPHDKGGVPRLRCTALFCFFSLYYVTLLPPWPWGSWRRHAVLWCALLPQAVLRSSCV